jgi:hypothetical protein
MNGYGVYQSGYMDVRTTMHFETKLVLWIESLLDGLYGFHQNGYKHHVIAMDFENFKIVTMELKLMLWTPMDIARTFAKIQTLSMDICQKEEVP